MREQNKMAYPKTSLYRLLERVIVIGIIVFLWHKSAGIKLELSEQKDLIQASTDSLKTWKSRDGLNLAKIAVLETRNANTLLDFKTTNETIIDLKELVKKYKRKLKKQGSATIVTTETRVDTVIKTVVVMDKNNEFPIYKSSIKDKWYNIESVATKDSTNYKFNTFSRLNIIIAREPQGLFKKDKPFAIIHDENPYTNIKDMRTYQVALPKPKRIGIGVYAGYGVSSSGQVLRTGWQLGVGVTYNVLKF